jgi:hypothetical protein
MAQSFPVTPEVIYDALNGDATFTGLIGTYNFEGTEDPIPALSVRSPGENLPQLRNVSGIECLIHDAGVIARQDYVSGPSDLMATWNLYLIAWPPSNGYEITSAAKRVMEIFGGATATEVVAVSSGLGALAQTLVQIPENSPILILPPPPGP